jgi:alpha-1,6-mannosyltransferase
LIVINTGEPTAEQAAPGTQPPTVGGGRPHSGTSVRGVVSGQLPLWTSGATGAVGALLVLVGGAQQGSPFTVMATSAWFFGNGASASSGVGANARFLGIVLVYLGIALMLGSWCEAVRNVLARPGTPIRPLVVILIAWEVPVFFMAPTFSRDVYAYAAQGQLVTRGINPYRHGPSALGGGPFLKLVDPIWRQSTAPYGPAWERLSGWIVTLSGHDVVGSVVGFRVIALIGVTLLAWAVPSLAHGIGRDGSVAFALAVLNPLVLLDLLGAAHNDALMVGLLVAACALARRNHVLVGLTLCALAAEVKIPALIGAAFIGWWWAGAEARWRPRLLKVVAALVLTAGLIAAISVVSGLGWGWVGGLSNPGSVVSWLDPATAVGLAMAHIASALGYAGHSAAFVHSARLVALGIAAVLSAYLLVRSPRFGDIEAIGWSLLAFVVLGPVVWPWYETWGFVFLAVVAEKWTLRLLLVLSAVACFADVPSPGLLVDADPILVAVCWTCLAGIIGFLVITRVVPLMAQGSTPKDGSAD